MLTMKVKDIQFADKSKELKFAFTSLHKNFDELDVNLMLSFFIVVPSSNTYGGGIEVFNCDILQVEVIFLHYAQS